MVANLTQTEPKLLNKLTYIIVNSLQTDVVQYCATCQLKSTLLHLFTTVLYIPYMVIDQRGSSPFQLAVLLCQASVQDSFIKPPLPRSVALLQ